MNWDFKRRGVIAFILALVLISPAHANLKQSLYRANPVYKIRTAFVTDSDRAAEGRSKPSWTGDTWWGDDKIKHISVSFALSSTAGMMLAVHHNDRDASLMGAVAGTMILGLGKEIWDMFHPGQPSWKDLAADALGALIGGFAARSIN